MAYFSYICAYVCYNLDILPSYYHETIPIIKQHLRLDSLCDCSRNVYPYARTDGELLGLRRIHFVGIQTRSRTPAGKPHLHAHRTLLRQFCFRSLACRLHDQSHVGIIQCSHHIVAFLDYHASRP